MATKWVCANCGHPQEIHDTYGCAHRMDCGCFVANTETDDIAAFVRIEQCIVCGDKIRDYRCRHCGESYEAYRPEPA